MLLVSAVDEADEQSGLTTMYKWGASDAQTPSTGHSYYSSDIPGRTE